MNYKCWLEILEESADPVNPTAGLSVQLTHAEKVVLEVARQDLVLVPSRLGLRFSLNAARDDIANWEIGSKRTFEQIGEVSSELFEPEIPSHLSPLSVRCNLEDGTQVRSRQFICLENYPPGVCLHIRSAKSSSLPSRGEKGTGDDWLQTVELPCVGEFDARFYIRKELTLNKITGISISAELEGLAKEVKFHAVNQEGFNVYRFQLYSDAECEYVLEWNDEKRIKRCLRVVCSASDEKKQRRSNSQFESLKEQHLEGRQTRSEISAERNDCFANRLQARMVGFDDSYQPIAIDIEYARDPLCQLVHLGEDGPLLVSDITIPSNDDPRPNADWRVPEELVKARRDVLELIRAEDEEDIVERIDLSSLFSGQAEGILINYVDQFHHWLKKRRRSAMWFDVHPILGRSTGNARSLSPEPLALMVSPLHPVRLYWQYRAQRLLTNELEKEQFSPGAGLLDSQSPTSQMALHLNHLKENRTFIAIGEFSPYWGILWNERSYGTVESIFKVEELFGESGKSAAGSLSAFQVERMMDEIARLTPARAETSVLIAGPRGSATCNSGILNWVSKDGKYFDEREMASGKLTVKDITVEKTLPDAKDLALYSEETDGGLGWYAADAGKTENLNHDLAIVPVFPPNSTEIQSSRTSSAISTSCLTRYALEWSDEKGTTRKQLGIAKFSPQANASVFDCTVREVAEGAKRVCLRLSFDRKPVADIIRAASFCGISGIGLDAVSLSATFKNQAVLWSYSIPALDAKEGDLNSYYILADAHDEIQERMQKLVKSLENSAVIPAAAMRQFGIKIDIKEINSGRVGKDLRNLGLVVDSPDAEGGMLINDPFGGRHG
ncbi:hypothetical protein N9053_02690 [bacterium]|nr:hypothetical protein [bacterium]